MYLLELSFRNFLQAVLAVLPLPAVLRFNTDRRLRLALQQQVDALQGEVDRLQQQLAAAKAEAAAATVGGGGGGGGGSGRGFVEGSFGGVLNPVHEQQQQQLGAAKAEAIASDDTAGFGDGNVKSELKLNPIQERQQQQQQLQASTSQKIGAGEEGTTAVAAAGAGGYPPKAKKLPAPTGHKREASLGDWTMAHHTALQVSYNSSSNGSSGRVGSGGGGVRGSGGGASAVSGGGSRLRQQQQQQQQQKQQGLKQGEEQQEEEEEEELGIELELRPLAMGGTEGGGWGWGGAGSASGPLPKPFTTSSGVASDQEGDIVMSGEGSSEEGREMMVLGGGEGEGGASRNTSPVGGGLGGLGGGLGGLGGLTVQLPSRVPSPAGSPVPIPRPPPSAPVAAIPASAGGSHSMMGAAGGGSGGSSSNSINLLSSSPVIPWNGGGGTPRRAGVAGGGPSLPGITGTSPARGGVTTGVTSVVTGEGVLSRNSSRQSRTSADDGFTTGHVLGADGSWPVTADPPLAPRIPVSVHSPPTHLGAPLAACAFSPSGQNLATSLEGGIVKVWSAPGVPGNVTRHTTVSCGVPVPSLCWDTRADKVMLLGCGGGAGVRVWHADTRRMVATAPADVTYPLVTAVAACPSDPCFIVAAATAAAAACQDGGGGGSAGGVGATAAAAGGGGGGGAKGRLTCWNSRSFKKTAQFILPADPVVTSLAYNKSGGLLLVGTADGRAYLMEPGSRQTPVRSWGLAEEAWGRRGGVLGSSSSSRRVQVGWRMGGGGALGAEGSCLICCGGVLVEWNAGGGRGGPLAAVDVAAVGAIALAEATAAGVLEGGPETSTAAAGVVSSGELEVGAGGGVVVESCRFAVSPSGSLVAVLCGAVHGGCVLLFDLSSSSAAAAAAAAAGGGGGGGSGRYRVSVTDVVPTTSSSSSSSSCSSPWSPAQVLLVDSRLGVGVGALVVDWHPALPVLVAGGGDGSVFTLTVSGAGRSSASSDGWPAGEMEV